MQVIALILSDVVGDPLDTIASGPTFSHTIDTRKVLDILEKFGEQDKKVPASVKSYLKSCPPQSETLSSSLSQNILNVIVGNNEIATLSAQSAAIDLGYKCYVWSRLIQGEASSLGRVYAMITHYISMKKRLGKAELQPLLNSLQDHLNKTFHGYPELETDVFNLIKMIEGNTPEQFCLIGAGEPTVTVTGGGKGGRNQELALAYAIKLDEMRTHDRISEECSVFASIGTDGQDGPCDAAGAIVNHFTMDTAREQELDPLKSLLDNDSYTFFSKLNSGRHLIKTGLTGTNVMDIHILLIS